MYDNQGSVCGISHNSQNYFFLKNLQGDVIAITNSDGEIIARYSYDAWGVCTVVSDNSNNSIATINPFRYRGYYYDAEIGMYYLQSRYYDPNTGRFINADSPEYASVTGNNLFAYCNNNPVMNVDRLGNCFVPMSPEEIVIKQMLNAGVYKESWIFEQLKKYGFTINDPTKSYRYDVFLPIEELGISIEMYFSWGYAFNYINKKGLGITLVPWGIQPYISFDCGHGYSVCISAAETLLASSLIIQISYCSSNYGIFGAFNIEFSISRLTQAYAVIIAVCISYFPYALPYIYSALAALTSVPALRPA